MLSMSRKHKVQVGITQIELSDGQSLAFRAHDETIERDHLLKQELTTLGRELLEGGHTPDLTLANPYKRRSTQLTDEDKQHLETEVARDQDKQSSTFPSGIDGKDVLLTDDEKHWSLCTHSERIAIAYGLLHVPSGEPIYLYKNLRICPDCHEVTRIISKIRNREIIMSDANRFHHFKDGKCSCDDYW